MSPKNASYATLGGALALAVAIPCASVGPMRFGIWHQVEGVIFGLHLAGFVATAGLVLLSISAGRARALAAASHPLVVLPGMLAAWSLFAAPFVRLPGLSLFGPVETGEGAIWYFDLAVLIAAALIVRRRRPWAFLIPGAAVAAAIAVAVLQTTGTKGSSLQPYAFTDYLAFHGIFAAATMIGWGFPPIPARVRTACAIGFATALIVISKNHAAQAMAGAAAIGVVGLLFRSAAVPTGAAVRRAAAALAVLAAAAVTAAPYLVTNFTTILETRARLFGVALAAAADHPRALVTGFGWGASTDLNFEYLHIDTAALATRNVIAGPTGEMLHFHSHNAFVEAFLSAGLIGLCLSVGIVAILPTVAARRAFVAASILAVVYAGVAAMWFQLAESLPLMAIAFAGFCGRPASRGWRRGARRLAPILPLALALVGGLQAFAAFAQFDVARRSQFDPWSSAESLRTIDCNTLMSDYGRGGRHLAFAANNVRSRLIAIADAGVRVQPEVAGLLGSYICATDRWTTEPRLLQVAAASLSARTDLAFRLWDPAYVSLRGRVLADWEDQVTRFLELAPERTDVARHYLYWRLALGDTEVALRLADRILLRRSDDPIGLWFKGLALSRNPTRAEEARNVIVRALRSGAIKMVDIDRSFLKSLGIAVVFPEEMRDE